MLVYTTTEGADPNVVELLTPSQGITRPLARALTSSIVANESSVPGATVTQALDQIAALLAPGTTVLDWTVAAPITLTLAPTGHAEGIYQVGLAVVIRQTATAGTLGKRTNWTTPGGFAAVFPNPDSVGTPLIITGTPSGSGSQFLTVQSVWSNGATPISMTLTPGAVTGTPLLDVAAYARRIF